MTPPTRHHFSLTLDGHTPELATDSWAAPGSTLIGRVHLNSGANVWYGAILRGDTETISIGANTNIQDGCVLHADPGYPTQVGRGVTAGHRAVLHGCTIGDDTLIGMGAVVLNGCTIGQGCLIAAGTTLLEGTDIPDGSLVAGTPGKIRRELTEDEQAGLRLSASTYVDYAAKHRQALDAQPD